MGGSLGLAVVVAVAASPAAAPEVAGVYRLAGWNPGAATHGPPQYAGTLTVKGKGRIYEVHWATRGTVTQGVGLLSSAGGRWLLSVGYATGTGTSVAVYEVVMGPQGPRLVGEWVGRGLGHELAEPLGTGSSSPMTN